MDAAPPCDFKVVLDPLANHVCVLQCNARAEAWWNSHQPEIGELMNELLDGVKGCPSDALLETIQRRFTRLVATTGDWSPVRVGLAKGTVRMPRRPQVDGWVRDGLASLLRQQHEDGRVAP